VPSDLLRGAMRHLRPAPASQTIPQSRFTGRFRGLLSRDVALSSCRPKLGTISDAGNPSVEAAH
jgi:hypothetical protein